MHQIAFQRIFITNNFRGRTPEPPQEDRGLRPLGASPPNDKSQIEPAGVSHLNRSVAVRFQITRGSQFNNIFRSHAIYCFIRKKQYIACSCFLIGSQCNSRSTSVICPELRRSGHQASSTVLQILKTIKNRLSYS